MSLVLKKLTEIGFYEVIGLWEMWKYFYKYIFSLILRIDILSSSQEIDFRQVPQSLIGSGNVLVPLIDLDLCYHVVIMS